MVFGKDDSKDSAKLDKFWWLEDIPFLAPEEMMQEPQWETLARIYNRLLPVGKMIQYNTIQVELQTELLHKTSDVDSKLKLIESINETLKERDILLNTNPLLSGISDAEILFSSGDSSGDSSSNNDSSDDDSSGSDSSSDDDSSGSDSSSDDDSSGSDSSSSSGHDDESSGASSTGSSGDDDSESGATDLSAGGYKIGPGNANEWWMAVWNPLDAVHVSVKAVRARAKTKEKYGSNQNDNEGDAFRHAYWNCLGARQIGASEMKKFGDAHEAIPNNPRDRKAMDLHNNKLGRDLSTDPESVLGPPPAGKKWEDMSCEELVDEAIRQDKHVKLR